MKRMSNPDIERFVAEVREIVAQRKLARFLAQGIEAATAGETTKIGSTEGESPVAESDAPKAGSGATS